MGATCDRNRPVRAVMPEPDQCPACDRYIGHADPCPYCGEDAYRPAALTLLRVLAVLVGVFGLALVVWLRWHIPVETERSADVLSRSSAVGLGMEDGG